MQTHACTPVHTHSHTRMQYTHTDTHTRTPTRSAYLHVHILAHTHSYTHTHTRTHTLMHAMLTHRHTHTQALTPLELVKAARKAWGESTNVGTVHDVWGETTPEDVQVVRDCFRVYNMTFDLSCWQEKSYSGIGSQCMYYPFFGATPPLGPPNVCMSLVPLPLWVHLVSA